MLHRHHVTHLFLRINKQQAPLPNTLPSRRTVSFLSNHALGQLPPAPATPPRLFFVFMSPSFQHPTLPFTFFSFLLSIHTTPHYAPHLPRPNHTSPLFIPHPPSQQVFCFSFLGFLRSFSPPPHQLPPNTTSRRHIPLSSVPTHHATTPCRKLPTLLSPCTLLQQLQHHHQAS